MTESLKLSGSYPNDYIEIRKHSFKKDVFVITASSGFTTGTTAIVSLSELKSLIGVEKQ